MDRTGFGFAALARLYLLRQCQVVPSNTSKRTASTGMVKPSARSLRIFSSSSAEGLRTTEGLSRPPGVSLSDRSDSPARPRSARARPQNNRSRGATQGAEAV